MLGVHALVAEEPAYFVHLFKSAHDKPFQIKFGSYAHEHIHIQRIVVGDERARGSSAGNGVEDRRFHFYVSPGIEERADTAYYPAALYEHFLDVGIGDKIDVPLAVTGVRILQTVIFFGQRHERFCQKLNGTGVHGNFTRFRGEYHARNADNVAYVRLFEFGIRFVAQVVAADVYLYTAAKIKNFGETCLTHDAFCNHAPRNFHFLALVFGILFLYVRAFGILIEFNHLEGVAPLRHKGSQLFAANTYGFAKFLKFVLFHFLPLPFRDNYFMSTIFTL